MQQPPFLDSDRTDLFYDQDTLPGRPGYRNRPGRSGLDWIETQYELAHMTGVFLRQFFSGAWRKIHPDPHPFIFLMVGIALISTFPGEACLIMPLAILIAVFYARRKYYYY